MAMQAPTPNDEHDVALFGKSDTPGIVAVHPVTDKRHKEASYMRVYRRDLETEAISSSEVTSPTAFLIEGLTCSVVCCSCELP